MCVFLVIALQKENPLLTDVITIAKVFEATQKAIRNIRGESGGEIFAEVNQKHGRKAKRKPNSLKTTTSVFNLAQDI